jgi:hypothetical protein
MKVSRLLHLTVEELTPRFFQECVETPVPIDLRAYKVLGEAPMAMACTSRAAL